MELPLYSIAAGVGLSAACGFRVFIPLLLMSGASLLGYYEPAEGFQWLATYQALAILGVATAAELLGYSVPWVDNALDTVASPAAVGAGILTSASVLGDFSPLWQWTLAVISGGGVAGLVQGGTVAARGASSAGTGGLGNILVAVGEGVASVVTTVLALAAPLAALVLVVVLAVLLVRQIRRRRARQRPERRDVS